MIKNYKDEPADAILEHGRNAIGSTFADLISEKDEKVDLLMEKAEKNKGFIGNLFQYAYYGIDINPDKNPDFEKAGIELKVAGYRKNKDGSLSADQRLVLSSIDFTEYAKGVELKESSLIKKCNRMLMFYFYLDESIKNRLDCSVDYMFDYKIFEIPKEDLNKIRLDYRIITNKIQSGKACEISESDTDILSACRRDGGEVTYYVGEKEYMALPRRFAFKNAYITYLLNEYIEPGKTCDAPKKKRTKTRDINIARGKCFEHYVESRLKKYIGKKAVKISKLKAVDYKKFYILDGYDKYNTLACKMLGVDSNSAPYLKKTATTIKAIRISKTNTIEQSVSFPAFKFKEIVEEKEWIESKTYDYLSERRFLFCIFKENQNGDYEFKGYKFYSLSVSELDDYFKPVWEKTKKLLDEGFELVPETVGGKTIYKNPLPGMKENGVCHIRPHSNRSAYKLKDGTMVGEWEKDANEMPDGQWMTTQSFWINNTYVKKILKDYID